LANLVLAGFDEVRARLTEYRVDGFNVQDHVEVLRGAEAQARFFHCECRSCAANEHVLMSAFRAMHLRDWSSPHLFDDRVDRNRAGRERRDRKPEKDSGALAREREIDQQQRTEEAGPDRPERGTTDHEE
jgi:hypothetical protein